MKRNHTKSRREFLRETALVTAGMTSIGRADILLQDKDQLARNLTEKHLAYATGAKPTSLDKPAIESIVNRVRANDYGFRTLIHEVVQSPLFQSK